MNTRNSSLAAAAILAITTSAAFAQEARTGVSHPDETNIEVSAPATQTPVRIPIQAVKPSAATPVEPVLHAASTMPPAVIDPATPRMATHADIDAGIVTRVSGPSNELPEGTLIKTSIRQEFNSKTTIPGTRFDATLIDPVLRDGHILLPAGAIISGRVTNVHSGRRISGAASIHLQPQIVTMPDGSYFPFHGQVIDTDMNRSATVDREGTIVRRDHPQATLAVLGAATGTAAIAGAVIAGVPGALVGAGVGAGLSTVVWLKQDRQEALPQNTRLTFALTSPLLVPEKK
jgi:hypothetical protein